MSVEMTFESMDDFSPAAVARKGVVRHCDVPDRRHYGFKGEFRQLEDLLQAITQPRASSGFAPFPMSEWCLLSVPMDDESICK